ncbi:MAG: hypothetical protein M3314_16060 [Actinomycetota bacterium]|nr:hypothetical protein [Actinomycetota bacterium]
MRKQARTAPLVGQLLFSEEGQGAVILDCVLAREGSGAAAVPVTLEARFPDLARAAAALELLDEWAESDAIVEVRVNEGRRGPEVEISSGSNRLVLEPED